MTKEEKIKEAWGEYYNENINSDGWFNIWATNINLELCDVIGESCRPKSLQGIENNNGWIKIESEADLPKENGMYHICYGDGIISSRHYHSKHNDWLDHPKATHYQPIEKPKPPLY